MKYAESKDLVNELDLEGVEKLRTVGIKATALRENFLTAIEDIDDKGRIDEIPEEMITAYNVLSKEVEDVPEEKEEPTPEQKEIDVEKDPIKKSQKKAAAGGRGTNKGEKRSRYGHVQSADSGKLDDLLFAGNTVAMIMENINVKRTRVVNHVKHLRNDKGLTVIETKPEGKDFKLNDTHYQVTEEFWTKD